MRLLRIFCTLFFSDLSLTYIAAVVDVVRADYLALTDKILKFESAVEVFLQQFDVLEVLLDDGAVAAS